MTDLPASTMLQNRHTGTFPDRLKPLQGTVVGEAALRIPGRIGPLSFPQGKGNLPAHRPLSWDAHLFR